MSNAAATATGAAAAAGAAAGGLSAAVLRSLKIKTGAVKRLVREREVYLGEVDEQHERIEKLRAREGVDDADIRKQNEVLEETLQMIPHMERRIRDAARDLENLVLATREGSHHHSAAELADADAAICAARSVVPAA
ncbi:hypothetical protein H4R18_005890 [Coemansia javaensis]|uniref:Tubulin-specific chaperone A n=1 Tax=Coemansia javaensis TaxID=2761396 RepID=A0A9W8H7T1_9FUNG|nr:hypothetical protein H4R18_005890 [Coemansia javaensis]